MAHPSPGAWFFLLVLGIRTKPSFDAQPSPSFPDRSFRVSHQSIFIQWLNVWHQLSKSHSFCHIKISIFFFTKTKDYHFLRKKGHCMGDISKSALNYDWGALRCTLSMEMNGAVTWQMVLYVKLCNDFQETFKNASTAKAGNDIPLSYFIPNSIKVPAAMVKYTTKRKKCKSLVSLTCWMLAFVQIWSSTVCKNWRCICNIVKRSERIMS